MTSEHELPPLPPTTATKDEWIMVAKVLHAVVGDMEQAFLAVVQSMHKAASSNEYCSEYDEIAEEAGLPPRPSDNDDDEFCCDACSAEAMMIPIRRHGHALSPGKFVAARKQTFEKHKQALDVKPVVMPEVTTPQRIQMTGQPTTATRRRR
jgi:hypothetical protein